MAEVKLRKDFTGTLVPKVSTDNLYIDLNFTYKGPAQTLSIDTSSGKKGLWGDYDQESPAYRNSFAVSKSDTPRSYTFPCYIPLAFWGDRVITDCAVEQKISGEGVYDSAVLWDAYTVNVGVPPVEKYTLALLVSPSGAGYCTGAGQYDSYAWATIRAYPYSGYVFDHWGGDYYGTANPASIVMAFNKTVTAYFKPVIPPTEFTLTVRALPLAGGWVTKSPDKPTYSFGEMVKLTASAAPGYRFSYWDCDGEWLRRLDGTVELSTSINFIVMASHTVTAHFTRV